MCWKPFLLVSLVGTGACSVRWYVVSLWGSDYYGQQASVPAGNETGIHLLRRQIYNRVLVLPAHPCSLLCCCNLTTGVCFVSWHGRPAGHERWWWQSTGDTAGPVHDGKTGPNGRAIKGQPRATGDGFQDLTAVQVITQEQPVWVQRWHEERDWLKGCRTGKLDWEVSRSSQY